MTYFTRCQRVAALLAASLLLGACGNGNAPTSTPSSTLGTDSAAVKVGGLPPDTTQAQPADTTRR